MLKQPCVQRGIYLRHQVLPLPDSAKRLGVLALAATARVVTGGEHDRFVEEQELELWRPITSRRRLF